MDVVARLCQKSRKGKNKAETEKDGFHSDNQLKKIKGLSLRCNTAGREELHLKRTYNLIKFP